MSNPFDKFDVAPTASKNPFDQFDQAKPADTDGPLARGWKSVKSSVGLTADLAGRDTAAASERIRAQAEYQKANPGSEEGQGLMKAWREGDGIIGGIKGVAGEVANDYNNAKGFGAGAMSVGRNLQAMGSGIVEQVPNMILPMAGMLAGGAAGSSVGPVGTAVGGFAGAAAGNSVVGTSEAAFRQLEKAGINPADTAAVKSYLDKNGDSILGETAVKGAVIGAVDTATMGLSHALLSGPGRAAANKALAALGVDVADKAAVSAASKTPAFKSLVANDAAYQASQTGAQKVARNAAAGLAEPAGEFTGEYAGSYAATGEADAKDAFLEAASSLGQSGLTFAGQKLYQGMTSPGAGFGIMDRSRGAQPVPPPEAPSAPVQPAVADQLGQSLTGTPMSSLMAGGGLTGAANPLGSTGNLTTTGSGYPGMNTAGPDSTVDPETGAIIPAEPGIKRWVDPNQQSVAPTPLGDSLTGASMSSMMGGSDGMTGAQLVPIKPSEQMGLNPAAGPLNAAAVTAVDGDATPSMQAASQAAAQQEQGAAQQQQADDKRKSSGWTMNEYPVGDEPMVASLDSKDAPLFMTQAGETFNVRDADWNVIATGNSFEEAAGRAKVHQASGGKAVQPTTGATDGATPTQAQQSIAQPTQAGGAATSGPAAAATAGQSATVGGSGVQAAGLNDKEIDAKTDAVMAAVEKFGNPGGITRELTRKLIVEKGMEVADSTIASLESGAAKKAKNQQSIDTLYAKRKASDGHPAATAKTTQAVGAQPASPAAGVPTTRNASVEAVGLSDQLEDALFKERDATTSAIENDWMNGNGRRRQTNIERAVHDAVTASTLDADSAAQIIETALENDRPDLAQYAASRAMRAAESMGTTPGVPQSSPKYGKIKSDLEASKKQALDAASALQEIVNSKQAPKAEVTPPNRENNPAQSGSYPAQSTPEARQRNLATLKQRMMAGRKPGALANEGAKPQSDITYEQFKQQMQSHLSESAKYKPNEVGQSTFIQKMADLADKYPEYEARLDRESNGEQGQQDDTMDDPEMAAYENGLSARTRAQDVADQSANAGQPSLDDQLKSVNDELANQGRVQNARTRQRRDQLRKAIAERDFPDVLKAVDGDVDAAEAINQALQFAGDEPRAKVVERVLKNRGITDEYRKRWGERLAGSNPEQDVKVPADTGDRAGTVSMPPSVDALLTQAMVNQKGRITRLRNQAKAGGTTLEERKAANLKVLAAEATLRKMRTTRFDAEDAVAAAMKSGNAEDARPIEDLFPKAFAEVEALLNTKADGAAQESAAPSDDLNAMFDDVLAEEVAKDEPKKAEAQKPASKTPAVDAHAALMDAVRTGKATPEQFKAGFEAVVAGAEVIKAELGTHTKADLLKMGGPYMRMRYGNENKPEIIDALYREMMGEFTLGESFTYGMAKDSYQNAIRRMVDATDADKLSKYVGERKAAIEEAALRRVSAAKAVIDPKTLDDFKASIRAAMMDGKSRKEAYLSLTPEQRIRFDELDAESTREARETRKRTQKIQVQAAGQTTGGQIIATKHTRDGYDLFVVQLSDRLSKDDYSTVLASAKRMGGWYSAFRGNGATPGFQFKEKASAEAFLKLAGGDTTAAQDQAAQRRDAFEDDRSQTAAERLTEMADRLEAQADEELGRDRKANTARRARFAASAEKAASNVKALAKTMRNIATAIGEGKAKFLDAVRQKTQVEMLAGVVATAKYNELVARFPDYGDREKRNGEPPTIETADFAEFPTFTAFRSDLANLARQMLEVDGTKKLGQQLMGIADDVTDAYLDFAKKNLHLVSTFKLNDGSGAIFSSKETGANAIRRSGLTGKAILLPVKRGENVVVMSPSEAMSRGVWKGDGDKRITLTKDAGMELVEAIGRKGSKTNGLKVPWQFETAADRLKALSRMGIETPSEFRSAVREFISLRVQAQEADRVKAMERAMIGRKADGLDFFPTPAEVADQMVEAAEVQAGMRILEPSAGMGHLADRIRAAGAEPDVVELSGDRRELLEEKGYNVVANDFMAFTEPSERSFTFGDLMRAPDGTHGILRGQGGMGSDRVRLVSDDAEQRELGKFNLSELDGIERRGAYSGYDRIIMNPPFGDRRDAEHVRHAYSLLKPGGRLVAIMGEGVFFGKDKKADDFREWLETLGGTSEKLPDGSFMDPSLPVTTGVNARMVVVEKPSDELPVFSRTRPVFSHAAQGQASTVVQGIVDTITARWANAPKVVVAFDMNDPAIPERVRQEDQRQRSGGATGTPEGFYYKGTVYLMSSKLAKPADVVRVLLHESLGHFGLRGVFGKELKPLLQQIATMRKSQVEAKMKEYGLRGVSNVDRLVAAEEVLAEMAQSSPQIGFVRRAVATIKAWLRKNIPGFMGMNMSDDEIISNFIMPARNYVVNGGPDGSAGGGVRFNRSADQTQSAAFSKWFGDSKVVGADGKPLVVYHGSGDDFSVFDAGRLGENTGYGDAEVGFHFSDNNADADFYASKAAERLGSKGLVRKFYLSMQNPLVIGMDESDGNAGERTQEFLDDKNSAKEYADENGHDGIIYLYGTNVDSGYTAIAFKPNQIKSATENNGDFDGDKPDIRFSRTIGEAMNAGVNNVKAFDVTGATSDQWDGPLPSKWDDYVFKLQDKLVDLKRVTQSITKWSGKLADDINVYLQEELYHGRTAKRVQDFTRMELEPALKQLAAQGFQLADLEEYMHARHAKEANRVIAERNPDVEGLQDGGSGMKDAEADAYFAKLTPSDRIKLVAVAAKFDAIMAETNRLMVEYELEPQSAIDSWGTMFKHYVPLHREDKAGGRGTGQGFSIKGRETKGRTGSKRKVVDIISHIAQARENTVVRGEKNRVSQALVGLVTAHPNQDFWKVGPPDSERVFNPKTGVVEERVNPLFKSLPNVVMAKVAKDGMVREVAVTFNEDDERAIRMAGALKNLDTPQIEGWLGTVAKMTRYFSSINTQYNPVFGVVNLVRDVQGAMINLGATELADKKTQVAKDAIMALTGIYRDIRITRNGGTASSEWSKLYEQFQQDGGQTGFRDLFSTPADRTDALNDLINPEAWSKSGLGKFFTADGRLIKPMNQIRKGSSVVFDWLSDYNEAMENGVRLAAYKAALDKGMTRQQAASLAKNLTVNFNRKGISGAQAGAVYAFFNAAMQGTARLGETLMTMEPGQPKTLRLTPFGKKVVYGGVLLGSIQALALAAGGFGDDEPPDFVRERSLIIPTGDKTYINIPMPLGLHVIPNIGRIATEFALSGFKNPAQRMASLAGLFADSFNPIGNAGLSMQTIAPTVLDPLVALTENKDWTGKPIARASSNKDLPGYTQHKDSASMVSKFLAEAINTLSGGNQYVAGVLSPTPDQIDYLAGQLGGGVWRELSKVEQTVTNTVTGEETPMYKIPLVGRFVGSAAGQSGEGNAFHANAAKLNRLETEIKGLMKDGKAEEAQALRASNPESRLIIGFNMAERRIQNMRKEKSDLIKSGADAERVKAVEQRITSVMSNMNQMLATATSSAQTQ